MTRKYITRRRILQLGNVKVQIKTYQDRYNIDDGLLVVDKSIRYLPEHYGPICEIFLLSNNRYYDGAKTYLLENSKYKYSYHWSSVNKNNIDGKLQFSKIVYNDNGIKSVL